MSYPEKDEDDIPDEKDSLRTGVGDGDGNQDKGKVEENSDDFIRYKRRRHHRLNLLMCGLRERPSGSDIEDDPVGPVTPSAGPTISSTATR